MAAELASQPETWARAADLRDEQARLPRRGARIAVVGCGTSWFMAQSYAWLRETGGHGETDAFAASEAFVDRGYDAVVALTRSGTTTEVLQLVERLRGRVRTVGVIGDAASPLVDLVDDAVTLPFADEQSVVQTRFATTALALFRASLGEDLDRVPIADARAAVDEELDPELVDAEQYTFLGRGWSVGLAHEAALKMREASQSWTESYPVDGVPPRPDLDRRARPGHLAVRRGARGPRGGCRGHGRPVRDRHARPHGRTRARAARRTRSRARQGPRPRPAAQPHPFGHPRGVTPMTTADTQGPLGSGTPVLAFDVGGTDTKSALVGADGRVLGLRRTPTPLDPADPAGAIVAVDRRARPRPPRRASPGVAPVAAGVSVPGLVDEVSGVGIFASNLGWRDAPDPRPRRAGPGLPVAFGHDVRAAGDAEHRLGAARGYGDVVVLAIGTGIASSLILDGRPYSGGGYAGEFGHSLADPLGEPCACGAIGCLETIASAGAIARRYRQASGNRRDRREGRARCGAAAAIRSRDGSGTTPSRRSRRRSPELVANLAPEAIVIGGGLAQSGPALFDPLARSARRAAQLPPAPGTRPRRARRRRRPPRHRPRGARPRRRPRSGGRP